MNLRKALKLGPTCERAVRGDLAGIWDRASNRLAPVFHNNKEEIWLNTRLPDTTLATLLTDHPAASTPLGTSVIIDEPAATGLTTPPTSTKISRFELICTYAADGATRVWRPRGTQSLFTRGGSAANPVVSITLSGATGNLGDLFTMPANLMALADTVLEYDIIVARTTGSTGTPSVGLVAGGQAIGVAAFTANANSLARVEGKYVVRTATSQFSSYNTPGAGAANSKGSGVNGTPLTLTSAQTFSIQIVASGTAADAFGATYVSLKLSSQ